MVLNGPRRCRKKDERNMIGLKICSSEAPKDTQVVHDFETDLGILDIEYVDSMNTEASNKVKANTETSNEINDETAHIHVRT